jgi:hypothetical protein
VGTAEEWTASHRPSIQGWMTSPEAVSRKNSTLVGKIFSTCR